MPSLPNIRPADVREGSLSTDSHRRHRTSIRYYLFTAEAPEIAIRFREAARRTIHSLGLNPHLGPRYSSANPRLKNLRSWPVVGFEAIRIYYTLEADAKHVIRILHGKRDVRRILENE